MYDSHAEVQLHSRSTKEYQDRHELCVFREHGASSPCRQSRLGGPRVLSSTALGFSALPTLAVPDQSVAPVKV